MFRLVHLSDVHLGPLPKVRRRELASKRITGYVNWHRNRRDAMGSDTLEKLIAHIHAAKADHIVITGDLVNLALNSEIELIADWLRTIGAPSQVTVIPGNHDTYVPGALDRIRHAWRPYMSGDGANECLFPFRRDLNDRESQTPISLIGCNSGRATAPFMATGSFREQQGHALAEMLERTATEQRFRVVLIHHPPFRGATAWNKRLIGASRFRKVVRQQGAELVLHGHTHLASDEIIKGPYHPVRVFGVPSASQGARAINAKQGKPGAQYNVFEIHKKIASDLDAPSGWAVRFDRFGYADGAREITHLHAQTFEVTGQPPAA